MRSKYLNVLFVLTLLCFPIVAFAHGGVEKLIGTTLVSLNQSPLSPLIGELVHMPFVFTNEKNNTPLAQLPVEVTVTDTFLGDETKDKVIATTNMRTDVNGVLDFSYTFSKENYFDIDLHFTDANGAEQETGFLVQPRAIPATPSPVKQHILFFLLGAVSSMLILKAYIIFSSHGP